MPVIYHVKSSWRQRAGQYVNGFLDGLWQDLNAPIDERQQRIPPRDLYKEDPARIPPPVEKPKRNDALLKLRQSYDDRANDLAKQLAEGKLTVAQWHNDMDREVRLLHTGSRVAGAGGFGALGPEDMAETERMIQEQQGYLDRWAKELKAGDTPLSEAGIAARARMYGSAANTTFDKAETAAIGMPTLPAYPGEESDCMVNCRCHWVIKKLDGSGNWDCFWKMNPAVENCDVCRARARTWSPLKIRNGEVQAYSRAGLFT
jgi:hypothetical protein